MSRAAALFVGMALTALCVSDSRATGDESGRYSMVAADGVVYRLDEVAGEICVFSMLRPPEGPRETVHYRQEGAKVVAEPVKPPKTFAMLSCDGREQRRVETRPGSKGGEQ